MPSTFIILDPAKPAQQKCFVAAARRLNGAAGKRSQEPVGIQQTPGQECLMSLKTAPKTGMQIRMASFGRVPMRYSRSLLIMLLGSQLSTHFELWHLAPLLITVLSSFWFCMSPWLHMGTGMCQNRGCTPISALFGFILASSATPPPPTKKKHE